MEKKNNSLVIILMGVIIVILAVLCVLFATNTISFNSKNDNGNEHLNENESLDTNDVNTDTNDSNSEVQKPKYEGQSFIGYYQILNRDFAVSKYNSSKNSLIDLEIQLLEDGTAKVAYQLNDQGHITKNQYGATYELVSTTTEQIDGDYYKVLQLTFNTNEAKNDENISFLGNETITYNPASNPTDGSQSFPKSLVFKGGIGNIIPYMINSNELKYIK